MQAGGQGKAGPREQRASPSSLDNPEPPWQVRLSGRAMLFHGQLYWWKSLPWYDLWSLAWQQKVAVCPISQSASDGLAWRAGITEPFCPADLWVAFEPYSIFISIIFFLQTTKMSGCSKNAKSHLYGNICFDCPKWQIIPPGFMNWMILLEFALCS